MGPNYYCEVVMCLDSECYHSLLTHCLFSNTFAIQSSKPEAIKLGFMWIYLRQLNNTVFSGHLYYCVCTFYQEIDPVKSFKENGIFCTN